MENKKANIIRLIFWGFITLLLLISGIMGAIYNNEIFSSRKGELENITKLFNTAEVIKNYETIGTKITAELKGKNIKVTYEGSNRQEYNFKLKNGYLETKIDKNDSIGRIAVMVITDSVAMSKGRIEGDTYTLFNDETILKYKLNDGIEYSLKNNTYTVKINLDKYLIKPYNYIEPDNNINNNEENELEQENDNQL